MQTNLDLATVTDIQQLKALKSDQYDVVEAANEQVQRSRQNILLINARIQQLQSAAAENEPAPAPVEE